MQIVIKNPIKFEGVDYAIGEPNVADDLGLSMVDLGVATRKNPLPQSYPANLSTTTNPDGSLSVTGFLGPNGGNLYNVFPVEGFYNGVFSDTIPASDRDAAIQAALDAADAAGGGTVLWSTPGNYESQYFASHFTPSGSVNAGFPNAYQIGDNTHFIVAEGVNIFSRDINSGNYDCHLLGVCNKNFVANRVYVSGVVNENVVQGFRTVTIETATPHGRKAGNYILFGNRADTSGTLDGAFQIATVIDLTHFTIEMWRETGTDTATQTLVPTLTGNNFWFYPCNHNITIDWRGKVKVYNINRGNWHVPQNLNGIISFNKVANSSVTINNMEGGRIMVSANVRNITIPRAKIGKHGSGIYWMGNTIGAHVIDLESYSGEDATQHMVIDNNMAYRDLDGTFAQGHIKDILYERVYSKHGWGRASLLVSAPKSPSVGDPAYAPLTDYWTIDNVVYKNIVCENTAPGFQMIYFGAIVAPPVAAAAGMYSATTEFADNIIAKYGLISVENWVLEDRGQSTSEAPSRLFQVEGRYNLAGNVGLPIIYDIDEIRFLRGKTRKCENGLIDGIRGVIALGTNTAAHIMIGVLDLSYNNIQFDRDYCADDPTILTAATDTTFIGTLKCHHNKLVTVGTYRRTAPFRSCYINKFDFIGNDVDMDEYGTSLIQTRNVMVVGNNNIGTNAGITTTKGSKKVQFTAGNYTPKIGNLVFIAGGVAAFPTGCYVTAILNSTTVMLSSPAVATIAPGGGHYINAFSNPTVVNVSNNGEMKFGSICDPMNVVLNATGVDFSRFSTNGGNAPSLCKFYSAGYTADITFTNCKFHSAAGALDSSNLANTFTIKSGGGNTLTTGYLGWNLTNASITLTGNCVDLPLAFSTAWTGGTAGYAVANNSIVSQSSATGLGTGAGIYAKGAGSAVKLA